MRLARVPAPACAQDIDIYSYTDGLEVGPITLRSDAEGAQNDLGLSLRQPINAVTSDYGHFGRDPERFPWERVDTALAAFATGAQLHAG